MAEHRTAARRPPAGRLDHDRAVVLDWLREYVGAPSEHLGRAGPVCPFIPAALNADTVRLSFRYGVDARDGDELHRLVSAELRDFKATTEPPKSSGVSLDGLLVVLPDAAEEGWRRIDQTYGALKDAAVDAGLMIGQFHPACTEPAVHNAAFQVSRSPIALYAVRYMAPHDSLFLHAERRWFEKYRARFPVQARSATGPVRPRALPARSYNPRRGK